MGSQRSGDVAFYLNAQADADGVGIYYGESVFTITGVSVGLTITGAPTAATIDLQEDGTDVSTGIDVSSNGYVELTDPVTISAETALDIDLNFTGGTTPAATGHLHLHILRGM